MTNFLHTYGAFILVVSVLLILPLLIIVCSLFLSAGSDRDDVALRELEPIRSDLKQKSHRPSTGSCHRVCHSAHHGRKTPGRRKRRAGAPNPMGKGRPVAVHLQA